MKKISAQLISVIFSPFVWTIFFFALALNKGLFDSKRYIILLFLLCLMIPTIIYIFLLKTKKLSDPDISKRQERYFILIVINVCAIVLLLFIKMAGLTLLFKLTLIAYVVLAISSLITFFYKISFHMTFACTFIILSDSLYGFKLWYLYLIIPTIFWSRLYLKKHTLGELTAALILDIVIIYNMI